ncbi:MAG: DUF1553 domain-containing protein [Planctomycetota bacterium]
MAALSLALLALAASSPVAEEDAPDFALEVRPLLARRCFACHGNDEETREAGLRLDLREEATRDRDGSAALVPGDPEGSELWARVTDEFDPMPPEHAGAPLDAEELSILRRWIESGAEYAPHWAFVAPERPELPRESTGEAHPIDAFLRAALLERGLDLSQPAGDHALLRRLSLDLTGLAPTPDEARAYAASTDPAKFEQAVERLLASEAYAERWAAVWLDLARYADSAGHGSDPLRTIWRYRDWVIEAFDRNLPFDEFTVQQLAGDLLPGATTDTRLATAFHRNTMTNTEGGTDDEEFRVLAVKDRVNTTMEVWMGLTTGCAECHSHKYDPISHVEYYELFDLFNQTADADRNNDAPRMATPTRAQEAEHARLAAAVAALDREIESFEPDLKAGARRLREEDATWARAMVYTTSHGLEVTQEGWVWSPSAPDETRVDRVYVHPLGSPGSDRGAAALQLVAAPRGDEPGGGPGGGPGSADGNFVLTDLRVDRVNHGRPLDVSAARVRIELPGEGRILSLAEVEVLGNHRRHVARGGRATQSSTGYGGVAERAVDGGRSGVYEDGSVTHTNTETDPWWEVELVGGEQPIHSIRVWNRTDGDLEKRLDGMVVVFLDERGREVHRTMPWPAPGPELDAHFGFKPYAPVRVVAGAATFEQDGFPLAHAVDADPTTGWAIAPRQGERHAATFLLPDVREPFDHGDLFRVTLSQGFGTNHTLGEYTLLFRFGPDPPSPRPAAVHDALQRPDREWTEGDRKALEDYLALSDPVLDGPRRRRTALLEERDGMGVVTTPVMEELPAEKRRATHVMARGNFLQPGEQVHAAVPAAFPALPEDAPADRLALARWLVSDENPLTARVAVNRVWSRLFGRGIVATEGDFGSQGAQPTHPELLDWLAVEFRENGWDHRALLRTIVTSRAYRQSSRVTADSLESDPDGVWLSRYPRQRLEAEMVRDVALQAAGLLSTKRFGPSVYPPQPDGLWQAAFNGQRNWKVSEGEDRYRRGLYVFLRRTIPYPMLATFDAPSRETCTVCRVPTNTPLQAFVTLNDPVFHEAAQALGREVASDDQLTAQMASDGSVAADLAWRGDVRKGVEALLWRVLARTPSEEHVRTLVDLYIDARGDFARDPDAARRFAGIEGRVDAEAAAAAAWTLIASAALNMDAVLTKE